MPDGIDRLIVGFDRALRTLSGTASAARPNPAAGVVSEELTPEERRHVTGLMRVNHTGEVCAQALYQAQALVARDPDVRDGPRPPRAGGNHLFWTQERLAGPGGRTGLATRCGIWARSRSASPRG
jgi:ubiquinone biosynthesis monooxygenase Coq7